MDNLKRIIRDYIVKEYIEDPDELEITEDTSLFTSGILDSFSMVSLRLFLEKKYSIQIPDAEATPAAFDTVVSIAEFVDRLRARPVRRGPLSPYDDFQTQQRLPALRNGHELRG